MAAEAEEKSGSEGKSSVKEEGFRPEIDFLAIGQYPYIAGDGNQLLENEGSELQPGFLLDHLLLHGKFKNDTVLDLAAGFFIPVSAARSEGKLSFQYRIPGKWKIYGSFLRFHGFYDDSISSDALAGTFFPFTPDLGEVVYKARDQATFGFTFTPDGLTSLSLVLDYSGEHGEEVPLTGSEYYNGSGFLFAYPGKNLIGHNRFRVRWDIDRWVGIVDLSLRGAYSLSLIDKTLVKSQLDGAAIAGANEYASTSTNHAVNNEAKISVVPIENLTLVAAYGIAYSKTKPAFDHRLENILRMESVENDGFSILRHIVPLTIDYRPIGGLFMRLQVAGMFANREAMLEHRELTWDPETVTGEKNGQSELAAKSFREKFVISYSGIPQTTVEVREELELTDYDAYLGLFDSMSPDEDRVFDFARSYSKLSVEAAVRSRIVPSKFKLDLGCKYWRRWSAETVEELRDWVPFGDQEDWRLKFNAKGTLSIMKKLTMLAAYSYTMGRMWRVEEIERMDDADTDASGHAMMLGILAVPCKYMSLLVNYNFNYGHYEVGPSPLLSMAQAIRYRGMVHGVGVTLGINPLNWWTMDGGYSMALVSGSVDTAIYRVSFDTRFRVHKNVQLGVGYMGRLFADDNASNNDYSGHLFRVAVKGEF